MRFPANFYNVTNITKLQPGKDRAMKVTVDRTRCTGLGICESIAPATFEVDDDDKLEIRTAEISSTDLGAIEQAVVSCPTEALSIED